MGRFAAFRFILDAAPEQVVVLRRHAGASRFAYNQCLRLVRGGLAARRVEGSVRVPWSGFDLINAVNSDDEYYAVKTFRRDGAPVSTPVWLAPSGGRLYGYTPGRSWKVRRIRRNPAVEFAPSTFGGEPLGPWRAGRARVLAGRELRTAKRAMTAKYGNRFRWFTIVTQLGRPRRHGGAAVGLEITLDPA